MKLIRIKDLAKKLLQTGKNDFNQADIMGLADILAKASVGTITQKYKLPATVAIMVFSRLLRSAKSNLKSNLKIDTDGELLAMLGSELREEVLV